MADGVTLARRRSRWVWPVASLLAGAVILIVVPRVAALPLAVGHAQLHALLALAVLVPAFAIAWSRRAPTVATTAVIVGFLGFGATQLVESVGGLGYGPDNDSRVNALAQVHDLGVGIAPVGLVLLLLGAVIALSAIAGRRSGRPALAAGVGVAVLLVGGLGIAKMLGF